jgi:hypothetical protein
VLLEIVAVTDTKVVVAESGSGAVSDGRPRDLGAVTVTAFAANGRVVATQSCSLHDGLTALSFGRRRCKPHTSSLTLFRDGVVMRHELWAEVCEACLALDGEHLYWIDAKDNSLWCPPQIIGITA